MNAHKTLQRLINSSKISMTSDMIEILMISHSNRNLQQNEFQISMILRLISHFESNDWTFFLSFYFLMYPSTIWLFIASLLLPPPTHPTPHLNFWIGMLLLHHTKINISCNFICLICFAHVVSFPGFFYLLRLFQKLTFQFKVFS